MPRQSENRVWSIFCFIYAGEAGVQLTWMDAKVDDWVVTPRIGKPVEINALWHNALCIMASFARHLGRRADLYDGLAGRAASGFGRFWNVGRGLASIVAPRCCSGN